MDEPQVSDNVFVATIFIEGVAKAYHAEGPDAMNMTEAHFGKLGVAISMVRATALTLLPLARCMRAQNGPLAGLKLAGFIHQI